MDYLTDWLIELLVYQLMHTLIDQLMDCLIKLLITKPYKLQTVILDYSSLSFDRDIRYVNVVSKIMQNKNNNKTVYIGSVTPTQALAQHWLSDPHLHLADE